MNYIIRITIYIASLFGFVYLFGYDHELLAICCLIFNFIIFLIPPTSD